MSFNREHLPFYSILILAILLPFNYLLSYGIAFMLLSGLFSQSIKDVVSQVKKRKQVLFFAFPYLLYLFAMIHTENTSFGSRDLGYKLSILILPFILAAFPTLSEKQNRQVLKTFLWTSVVAALVSFFVSYKNNGFTAIPTYIDLSIFMHPGYFSAYLNLALIFLIKELREDFNKGWFGFLVLFISAFVFLLNSKIGIIVNVLILLAFTISLLGKLPKKWSVPIVVLFLGLTFGIGSQVKPINDRFKAMIQATRLKEIPKDASDGTSLRILIRKQVKEVLADNLWIGVGTGDTKDVLMDHYKKNGIIYAYQNKLNSHNQFLEWLITFGLIGTLLYLVCILIPLVQSYQSANWLYIVFMAMAVLYFMSESFLEREAGIIYFSFFNAFLFFNQTPKKLS